MTNAVRLVTRSRGGEGWGGEEKTQVQPKLDPTILGRWG